MGVVTSVPVQDEFPLARNRKNWIETLVEKEPLNFGGLKLFEIVIPASHNSATYGVEPSLVSSIAMCQKEDIASQLASGIRFLDLRICDDTPENVLTISHRFLCGTLGEAFHQIFSFMTENTSELLIVAIKKDWDRGLSEEGIKTVAKMITNYFSDFLMSDADVHNFSIKHLIELNKRILFISDDLDSTDIPVSKMSQSWCDTNSANSKKLLRKLDTFKHEEGPCLRVHDCYVTPNAESITKWTVKNINWHQVQKDNNGEILNWLKERTSDGHNFNIISLDMVSQDLIDFIISLNPRKIY